MKWVYESDKYFKICHARWATKVNRDLSLENPPDEWVLNQCESCRYWIPLAGKFCTDWGACSNSDSKFDRMVQFAHDGCNQFIHCKNDEQTT